MAVPRRATLAASLAALVVAGVLAVAHPLAAQRPSFERRVAAEIAARWGVSPGAVRLRWLAPSRADTLAPDAPFALLEPSPSGVWLVALGAPAMRAPLLELRAGVAVERSVAARPIARGTTLSAADIRRDSVVIWSAPPAVAGVAPGWIARRLITPGQPLRPPAVAPAPLVRAGVDADVEWSTGPVRISRRGTAATDGSLGDQVWIRLGDGRRVRGTVTGSARVAADSAADLR